MPTRYGHHRKQPYTVEKRLREALEAIEGSVGFRSDGRQHDTGLVKPYRPVPADFEAVYIRNGWHGDDGDICDIFCTNWRVIRRWIEIVGRSRLAKARAAFVETQRRERRERRRLTAVRLASGKG